jgi:hypothetical protein
VNVVDRIKESLGWKRTTITAEKLRVGREKLEFEVALSRVEEIVRREERRRPSWDQLLVPERDRD